MDVAHDAVLARTAVRAAARGHGVHHDGVVATRQPLIPHPKHRLLRVRFARRLQEFPRCFGTSSGGRGGGGGSGGSGRHGGGGHCVCNFNSSGGTHAPLRHTRVDLGRCNRLGHGVLPRRERALNVAALRLGLVPQRGARDFAPLSVLVRAVREGPRRGVGVELQDVTERAEDEFVSLLDVVRRTSLQDFLRDEGGLEARPGEEGEERVVVAQRARRDGVERLERVERVAPRHPELAQLHHDLRAPRLRL